MIANLFDFGTRVRVQHAGGIIGTVTAITLLGPDHTVRYTVEWWINGDVQEGIFYESQLERVSDEPRFCIGFCPSNEELAS